MKTILLGISAFLLSLQVVAQDKEASIIASANSFNNSKAHHDTGSKSKLVKETKNKTTLHGKKTNLNVLSLVKEMGNDDYFSVYSGSDKAVLNVEISENNIPYRLYTNSGKLVSSGLIKKSIQIDFSNFPNGNYILNLNGIKTHKITKLTDN